MASSKIYKNGTYTVIIQDTGTKKYIGQEFIADFPDSLDLKITEQCMHGCPFCHENSTKTGKHGDLDQLVLKLKGLPRGVELAIGGGNALLHPGLMEFLRKIKDHFNVAVTVHWKDITNKETRDILNEIYQKDYVNSIGISLADINMKTISTKKDVFNITRENEVALFSSMKTVFHVIPGVTPFEVFKKILFDSFAFSKVLVLGFKQFGRAKDKELPLEEFKKWRECIQSYNQKAGSFLKMHKTIAFDNLALEQLDIKNIFPEEIWSECYMGEEFTHSM